MTREDLPVTIHIVQAVHFSEPGSPMSAHETRELAEIEALSLVNIMRRSVGLPEVANPKLWETALLEAREAHAADIGCPLDEIDEEDDGDVWITELAVQRKVR